MKNLFTPTPSRPPTDAVARFKSLMAAGLLEDEARAVVGREIDGKPPAAPVVRKNRTTQKLGDNLTSQPALSYPRAARETPVSPDITNRFRPVTPEPVRERFNAVAHYSLVDPAPIGQSKRGPVLIGYTLWDESDERARYNGTLHIAGLGQSTINLSFDALAGLVAAAPKIEAYLAQHGAAIASAEKSGAAARKGRKL